LGRGGYKGRLSRGGRSKKKETSAKALRTGKHVLEEVKEGGRKSLGGKGGSVGQFPRPEGSRLLKILNVAKGEEGRLNSEPEIRNNSSKVVCSRKAKQRKRNQRKRGKSSK